MILSARGTSGSGKTTLARHLLHATGYYQPAVPVFDNPNTDRHPVYYYRDAVDPGQRGLAILGTYEKLNGGTSGLLTGGYDTLFDLCRSLSDTGYDVFFEGRMVSSEYRRTAALHTDGYDVRLFYFDLPLAECLASYNTRRTTQGKPVMIDTAGRDIERRYRGLLGHPERFRSIGVNVTVGGRDAAVQWAVDLGMLHE